MKPCEKIRIVLEREEGEEESSYNDKGQEEGGIPSPPEKRKKCAQTVQKREGTDQGGKTITGRKKDQPAFGIFGYLSCTVSRGKRRSGEEISRGGKTKQGRC